MSSLACVVRWENDTRALERYTWQKGEHHSERKKENSIKTRVRATSFWSELHRQQIAASL